jgi:hypothetical protein
VSVIVMNNFPVFVRTKEINGIRKLHSTQSKKVSVPVVRREDDEM